ncbi:MBL fold metallo-hydrolase [Bacillus subtilis]|uniref:MBL fold metallo-hydrolase RNA specificity domain-containing protein n=1 Tax=Pseudochrobactrum asaccharolyticum TaxID=354351 RepID=UPI001F3C27A9|nr:MBL fold metallo-hydrolase [Pseudochrobactrum asaccharolyticum]MCF7645383.1 MBL fold metallo-hydrolase [Pseudochrobactrum asaccharolyticum]MCF7671995.1 MBL fold metallo-hydrolase [Bacillus subtilis]
MLTLKSLGAAGTVTGSKHLLSNGRHNVLIDCGLFQGLKNLRELNWESLSIPARDIDAVILTHAHLDHSGYLPRLVKEGFRGKIYSTAATRDVAELILKDSGHLQEKDADFLNRHKLTKHAPALALYTARDAEIALGHFSTADFDQTITILDDLRFRFRHAGHILGAANVQIDWSGKRIVFSGDIGRYNHPLMPDPVSVKEADYVVVESTYGNRLHDHTDPAEALGAITEKTIKRGGTLVIPSFAVGRAQELLYYFWKLKQAGRLGSVPIFLDSPMAIDATTLMSRHMQDHKLSPDEAREAYKIARYTEEVEDSKAISNNPYPKVVISASGMATGGRILHHLKNYAPDMKNTILLAGFQAAGTRGRTLREGAKELKIHGMWVPVNAEVAHIDTLSGHADANELIRWLSGFKNPPRKTFIVHGEPDASEGLRIRIGRELGWDSVVPRQDQEFKL